MTFNTLSINVGNTGPCISSPSNLGRPECWTVQFVSSLKNWESYCGLCASVGETHNVEFWLLFWKDVDVLRLCKLKNYYTIFKFLRWCFDEPIYRSASFRLKTIKTLEFFSFLTKFSNHNTVLRLVILPNYSESIFKGLQLGYCQNPTLPQPAVQVCLFISQLPIWRLTSSAATWGNLTRCDTNIVSWIK
jgi:hypothetical protein